MTPVCGHEYFGLIWSCMDWDDEYDNMDDASHREESFPGKSTEGGLDPMAITDPVSAYFILSDDAQEEISGADKKKMAGGQSFNNKTPSWVVR